MSKVTPLAYGPINAADSITVELVEAEETPTVVLVRWPAAPSVASPVRFPAAALAVIAVLDRAMIELARIEAREQ